MSRNCLYNFFPILAKLPWSFWIWLFSIQAYAQEPTFVSYNADTHTNFCIATSPEGAYVYAGGMNTIAVFKCEASGTLAPVQVLNQDHLGVRGIRHVIDMAVSPDGRHLYAVNSADQTLAIFARDFLSGRLDLIGVYRDSAFAWPEGFVFVPSIESNYRLLLSLDGEHLYWLYQNQIRVFARDRNSGLLDKIQILQSRGSELEGYSVPSSLVIAQDGKHLYGGGDNGTKLLMFVRDTTTRQIRLANVYETGPSLDGRWRDGNVSISNDGLSVYATYADIPEYGKVFVYRRNLETGGLTLVEALSLLGPNIAFVSPDGNDLYVEVYGGKLATYLRDPQTGFLMFKEYFDCGCGVRTASQLTMSPTGEEIFFAGGQVLKRDRNTGNLSILQNYNNNIGGTDRLYGSKTAAVSRDGNALFVAARYEDGGINVFSRDQEAGQITQSKFYPQPHLENIFLSPDGQQLYAVNDRDTTLEVFRYDALSQSLHSVQKVFGNGKFSDFSSSGEQLYLSSQSELLIYARDLHSGRLNLVQTIIAWDLDMAARFAVAVSPDGRYVYWSGYNRLLYLGYEAGIFERNSQSGELTFLKRQQFGQMLPGWGLKFSPDGRFLYAGAQARNIFEFTGEWLATFSRRNTTGELTLIDLLRNSDYDMCKALEMSADGKDLYALVGENGSVLHMFERASETGKLTPRKTFYAWREGVYGYLEEDLALSPNGVFLYVTDHSGVATFSTGRSRSVGVAEKDPSMNMLPSTFNLHQNYPNPFNPSTQIKYDLPKATRVKVVIFDMLGRKVRTLIDSNQKAGYHAKTWDGRSDDGVTVASGIYFYRVITPEFVKVRKMMLLR